MTAPADEHDAAEIARRGQQLRALVASLVGDPDRAAEIEQEVWLSALQGPLDRIHSWRSWCRTAALNLLRGRRRRRADQGASPLEDDVPAPGRSPSQTVEQLESLRRLNDALARLEEPGRSAVVMRFLTGMEPREIARELRIPASTVRSRIARGLEQLRREMDRGSAEGRRAWATPLAGLLGLPVAGSPSIGAVAVPRAALVSRVTRLVLGGFLVKKVIVPVVVLGVLIAVVAGLGPGRDDSRLEPNGEVAKVERGETGARRETARVPESTETPVAGGPSEEAPTAPVLARVWTLAGSVSTPGGAAIGGARIILRPLSGAGAAIALEPDAGTANDGGLARTRSSTDGRFALSSPEAGRFECFAHAEGHRPRRETVTLGPDVGSGRAWRSCSSPCRHAPASSWTTRTSLSRERR
ncbi:MAG: sigma-70 family RNA polymerase sigma factor [Planctomycetota bacterium]